SELFSREGGKFVCATAGPNLESLLAAHGSGAVELSQATDAAILNVDIGGGTTKFAVCQRGEVRETAAVHLGARLLAWDKDSSVIRLEDAGRRLAESAGLEGVGLGARVAGNLLDGLANAMGRLILDIIGGTLHEGEMGLWITPVLRSRGPFGRIVFSGGVAEYIYGREKREFGDLGPRLAAAVRRGAEGLGLQLLEPREAIRATCIGASQYVVQLSGDTIYLSHPDHLPLRNVPVAAIGSVDEPSAGHVSAAVRQALIRLDLGDDGDSRFALAVQWRHGADYHSLRALCQGIVEALPAVRNGRPLLLVVDADIAGIVGALLQQEFKVGGALVCRAAGDAADACQLLFQALPRPAICGPSRLDWRSPRSASQLGQDHHSDRRRLPDRRAQKADRSRAEARCLIQPAKHT